MGHSTAAWTHAGKAYGPVSWPGVDGVPRSPCPGRWYALYVRSRFEFTTRDELEKSSIETFLPTVVRPRRWKDRMKDVEFPLFPGYLFFRNSRGREGFLPVLRARGAVTVLSRIPGEPTPVAEREIESLKVLTAGGGEIDVYPHLREGTPVRMRSGPLEGAEGVLQRKLDQYLFMVNVDILGRSVGVRVFAEDLEPL